jgi:hypothetical protein
LSLDVFSQFCEDLKAGAITAGITAGQITLGHWEQPAPTVDSEGKPVVDNLWDDVAKNGFYLFIEAPKSNANLVSRNGVFSLRAKLIGSFPANASDNLQAIQLQHAKLLDAWANMLTPWDANPSGNRQPTEVDSTLEYIFHENPYIIIVNYMIKGAFKVGEAANPILVPAP